MSSTISSSPALGRTQFLAAAAPGQFWEPLFAAMPDILFFVKNRAGQFMAISDEFIALLGANSRHDVLGKTDHDFTPAYLADTFRKDDLHVMKTGEVLRNRIELVPNNDAVPDWRVTTKMPVFGNDGSIIGVAGITRALRQARAIYGPHADLSPVLDYIRNSFAKPMSVGELATLGNVSVSTLERRFKSLFGTTPLQYLRKVRINAACQALKASNDPIAAIACDCGFADQSSLTRQFREFLHITPHAYRKQFSGDPHR